MVLKKKQAIKTHEALNLFNIGVTKSKQVTPAPPPKKKDTTEEDKSGFFFKFLFIK